MVDYVLYKIAQMILAVSEYFEKRKKQSSLLKMSDEAKAVQHLIERGLYLPNSGYGVSDDVGELEVFKSAWSKRHDYTISKNGYNLGIVSVGQPPLTGIAKPQRNYVKLFSDDVEHDFTAESYDSLSDEHKAIIFPLAIRAKQQYDLDQDAKRQARAAKQVLIDEVTQQYLTAKQVRNG